MDNFRNTYGLAIGNDEPSLAATAVKLLQEKQKHDQSSSININLSQWYPSAITPLKEHHTSLNPNLYIEKCYTFSSVLPYEYQTEKSLYNISTRKGGLF